MRFGPMNLRLLPYTPARDVYRLLGVPSSASNDEITLACRRLAQAFHPDRNRSERATQEMQVVNVVRRVMTDPDTRALYDRERHRFHAARLRPVEPVVPAWRPADVAPRGRSPLRRYARATFLGLRAAAIELAPSRCGGCRMVVANGDAYCVACGVPLLTGG